MYYIIYNGQFSPAIQIINQFDEYYTIYAPAVLFSGNTLITCYRP